MKVNGVIICCFTIISAVSSMHSMEYANHELQDCFTNKTVLNYDGNTANACYIAQTAQTVHFDVTKKNFDEILALQEKYADVKNLIFKKPQSKFYDVVSVYNCNILCKKNMGRELAINVKDYLKEDGEIHALVKTQNNYLSIENAAMLKVYFSIYEQFSPEMKQKTVTERHPNHFAETFKLSFSTDDEIKDNIWTAGYDIISYKEVEYEDRVKIVEIKKILKFDFLKIISECKFLPKTKKLLWKELEILIFNQYKKSNNDEVVVPAKATKIHLRNAGFMRLSLNVQGDFFV